MAKLVTRRQLLRGVLTLGAATTLVGGYAVAEPWRLVVTKYLISPPDWPRGLTLRCAVIADLHACEPWMGEARIRQIVARTNALSPDVTLLLGDYLAGHRLSRFSTKVPKPVMAQALAGLKAPLGVYAVLGNHDWWNDIEVQLRRSGPVPIGQALEAVGIPVLHNRAVRLIKDGRPFWIAGLGDQWAYWPRGNARPPYGLHRYEGVDDLPGTLRQVTDEAPAILLAHEPDIFPKVPDRIALTISGHTHGGQVTIAGYAPVVPSAFGRRYRYGHIVEARRHMVVSGGLGCSGAPIRFGVPPEIVVIELGAGAEA
jgi:predicted MPP superfamily phosphohydrolase